MLSSTSCPRVRVVNAGLGAEDKSGLTYIGHWVVVSFLTADKKQLKGAYHGSQPSGTVYPDVSGDAGSCLEAEDCLLTSWIRKQRKGKASSVDFLFSPFYSKSVSASVGWYHPHSERVFPPQ